MNEQAIVHVGNDLVSKARALVVQNHNDFEQAQQVRVVIRERLATVHAEVDPVRDAAYKAYQEALGLKKRLEAPYQEADKILKTSMDLFATEQARIAAEARKKAEAEARAAEERERSRLEKRAEKAEAKGQEERAEDLRTEAAAVYVAPTPVFEAIPSGSRRDIECTVTNMLDLCLAIATRKVPANLVKIDATALKNYCKAVGGSIPGVHVAEKIITTVRGAK